MFSGGRGPGGWNAGTEEAGGSGGGGEGLLPGNMGRLRESGPIPLGSRADAGSLQRYLYKSVSPALNRSGSTSIHRASPGDRSRFRKPYSPVVASSRPP